MYDRGILRIGDPFFVPSTSEFSTELRQTQLFIIFTTILFVLCYLCPMKVFVTILSIYILYLISLPCIDSAYPSDDLTVLCTHQQNQKNDDNHHDACSPFCICSCCSLIVIVFDIQFVSKPYIKSQPLFFPPSEDSISNLFYAVWVPPKLS